MNRLPLISMAAWVVLATSALAQTAGSGGAPQFKPLLSPGNICTTTFSYPSLERKQKAGKPYVKSPVITKRILTVGAKSASQVLLYSDQEEVFRTFRGHFILSLSSLQGPKIVQKGGEDDPGEPDFREKPFPELDWVSAAHFKGTKEINNTEYLVWQETDPIPALSKILLVDAATGLPHSFESYHVKANYAFSLDPKLAGQRVPLPPDLQAAWQRMKNDTKRYLKVELDDE